MLAIPGSQDDPRIHCLLSEQGKVRLVGSQGQHDQVSVQSVQAMPCGKYTAVCHQQDFANSVKALPTKIWGVTWCDQENFGRLGLTTSF